MRRIGTLMGMVVILLALFAGSALAAIFLTPQDDTYSGNAQPNTIFGRGGADLIRGLGGGDLIVGNAGADDLYGGALRDKLFGRMGNDLLVGGSGEDQLNGNRGNDVIVAGDDKVADEVVCGPGNDIAFLSGPDHSSLAQEGCERVRTFQSMSEVPNPGGRAGS